MNTIITEATTATDYIDGRFLIEEYAVSLGIDLSFQNFDLELLELTKIYGPPTGCLLFARRATESIGCVTIRKFGETLCEMKRLYVKPLCRKLGIGRMLAAQAIDQARRLGYRRILLDTLPKMQEAQSLYESLGFQQTERYYSNPLEEARYLALDIEPHKLLIKQT